MFYPSFQFIARDTRGGMALYAGFTVFIITVAAYAGLILLIRTHHQAAEAIVLQIEDRKRAFDSARVEEFTLLHARFQNIGALIGRHAITTNILALVERDAIPQVRFNSFDFHTDAAKVMMRGTALSYAYLARQLNVFEQDDQIVSIEFSGLTRSKEGIGFDLALLLKPEAAMARKAP